MNNFVIKGGRVIDPENKFDQISDILIKNGFIEKIENGIETDFPIIDATDKLITPGFVEIHAHFREPGFTNKETLETGSLSALKGGYTTVCVMPNTNPVIDNTYLVDYLKLKAKDNNLVKIEVIGAVSKGLEGVELTNLLGLKEKGVVAYSDDGMPIMNANFMKNALDYISNLDMPIVLHEEDHNLSKPGVINEGFVSTKLGLAGTPGLSEEVMIARDVILAGKFNSHIHIAHVSTKKSIEIIEKAQKSGINVTCEVTPHHLVLNENEFLSRPYDTNLKMSPPLRTKEDMLACQKGLFDGIIQAVATDHAPHSPSEKEQNFDQAPNGIIGLETAFPVLYTNLVKSGLMNVTSLVEKFTSSPASIFNLDRGNLSIGSPADLTIIDLDKEFVYDKDLIASRSKNSPWLNQKFYGKIIRTIVNGETKYMEENNE
ncbi:MAG: dihydroorotase [Clostridia bacterium]